MFARLFLVLAFATFFRSAIALPQDAAGLDASPSTVADDGASLRFYQRHGKGLAWSGTEQAKADAGIALGVLSRAASEGLDPEHYRVYLRSGNNVADDVALSAALLTYMHDLTVGRLDLETLDADVAMPQRRFDAAQALDEALRQNRLADMLAALVPPSGEYSALRGSWRVIRTDRLRRRSWPTWNAGAGCRAYGSLTVSSSMQLTPPCSCGSEGGRFLPRA